ncbi:GIY-YIG nuclease family protein [Janibacter cremeus]|uniref:Bacteriophage T5 Orf172 DNA-binding domain-containing protein n=1 Tax=Janibacter cremeus TaxID=1285192 RepID=A0A852VRE0_9MICO|nr:GIY-YIG nuclease family protein [Janibacter cremeus]NYF96894.1 hypothetical protein [Janibacter cremeus]
MTEVTSDTQTESVRQEIRAYLTEDETRLGDVYRLREEGLSATEMAEKLGIPSVGFTYTYGQQLDALIEGSLPWKSAHLARQTAARARTLMKTKQWSPAARSWLEELELQLDAIGSDEVTRAREEDAARDRTEQVEDSGKPGIYVYSLPHYLRNPYDPERGHTLLKVGRSQVDVFQRTAQQSRTTALPEDPLLLRVYPTSPEDASAIERYFHTFLEDADHLRNRSSRAGREWFLTTTKFLDRLALEKGLTIEVVNELDPATD